MFGDAEKKIATRPQRVMEQRNDPILQLGTKIDQEIAARNQVYARERRIADDAVGGEDAQLADSLRGT